MKGHPLSAAFVTLPDDPATAALVERVGVLDAVYVTREFWRTARAALGNDRQQKRVGRWERRQRRGRGHDRAGRPL